MRRSLITLLKDTAPAILPLLSRMTTFSQQSCCYPSQLKDCPLLTSHPLSSYCSISLLPFLAKLFTEVPVLGIPRKSSLAVLSQTHSCQACPLPSTPSALDRSPVASLARPMPGSWSSLILCLSALWDMADLSLLGLFSPTPLPPPISWLLLLCPLCWFLLLFLSWGPRAQPTSLRW